MAGWLCEDGVYEALMLRRSTASDLLVDHAVLLFGEDSRAAACGALCAAGAPALLSLLANSVLIFHGKLYKDFQNQCGLYFCTR